MKLYFLYQHLVPNFVRYALSTLFITSIFFISACDTDDDHHHVEHADVDGFLLQTLDNKEIYRELGCDDGHRSCESNLHEALSFIGLEIAVTPGPLNLFMNVPVASDGTIDRAPPLSRPGDLVTLQTVMDTIVVFSACPQDVTPINGAQCIPRDAHYTIIAR